MTQLDLRGQFARCCSLAQPFYLACIHDERVSFIMLEVVRVTRGDGSVEPALRLCQVALHA